MKEITEFDLRNQALLERIAVALEQLVQLGQDVIRHEFSTRWAAEDIMTIRALKRASDANR